MSTETIIKALTKTQIISALADSQGTTKATAEQFITALAEMAQAQLGPSGPGSFVVPGVVKLKAVAKAATPEREGINPFTKAKVTIKAKPASRKVRASVVKSLKDAVA